MFCFVPETEAGNGLPDKAAEAKRWNRGRPSKVLSVFPKFGVSVGLNGLELPGTRSQKPEDCSLPAKWPAVGPWTARRPGRFWAQAVYFGLDSRGSVQPGPGDVLATPNVCCHCFKVLSVSRSVDGGTGEGLASSGRPGSAP